MSYPLWFYAKIAFFISSLGYAAVQDVKMREVDDLVWFFSIPVVLFFTLLDCAAHVEDLIMLAVSLASAAALGILFHHLGFYGGADVKALILIASAFPSYPSHMKIPVWMMFPLPLLAILAAASIFTSVYPVLILLLNLIAMSGGNNPLEGIDEKSPFKKLLLLMTARRVPLEELKNSLKYFPAEKIEINNGHAVRKPRLFVHAEADVESMVTELARHKELLDGGILASPTIPMIAFLEAASMLLSILLLL